MKVGQAPFAIFSFLGIGKKMYFCYKKYKIVSCSGIGWLLLIFIEQAI